MNDTDKVAVARRSDNWTGQTVATWENWRNGNYLLAKANFYGPWHLKHRGESLWTGEMLQDGMAFARQHQAQATTPTSEESSHE